MQKLLLKTIDKVVRKSLFVWCISIHIIWKIISLAALFLSSGLVDFKIILLRERNWNASFYKNSYLCIYAVLLQVSKILRFYIKCEKPFFLTLLIFELMIMYASTGLIFYFNPKAPILTIELKIITFKLS